MSFKVNPDGFWNPLGDRDREKIALGRSPPHFWRGQMTPSGSPREPEGELKGTKIAIKNAPNIELDFQSIFDAKIIRKSFKINHESRKK